MCVPGAQGATGAKVDPRLLQMAQAATQPQSGGAQTPTNLGPTGPAPREPLTNVLSFKPKAKGK